MDKRKRGRYGSPDPYLNLTVELVGRSKMTGVSIGKALGTCENTGRARLAKPETITLAEMKKLCRAFDITQEEFVRLIKIGV